MVFLYLFLNNGLMKPSKSIETQNIITPFTQSSINAREGIAIEIALNQNRTKKDRHVKASDVLSYLKGELSEVFEHQDIKKVKSIMQNLAMFDIDPKTHDIYPAICGSLKRKWRRVKPKGICI